MCHQMYIYIYIFNWIIKSSNLNFNNYKISFRPYFSIKDLLGLYTILFISIFINFHFPYHLGDPDHFKIVNPINTNKSNKPTHIKPD